MLRTISTITTTTTIRRYNHVVVALSGGVDSSVAAALLKETSTESLSAVHMTNWSTYDDDSQHNVCPTSQQDWKDACATSAQLDIPLERKHFEAAYWNTVFEPYLSDIWTKGSIGNPDIGCNKHIKFGVLFEHCRDRFGPLTRLATGHYARLWYRHGKDDIEPLSTPPCVEQALEGDLTGTRDWIRAWGSSFAPTPTSTVPLPPILLAAADRTKDQSYFLSGCEGQSLASALFPLGDLCKKAEQNHIMDGRNRTVRELAHAWHLPAARKRESMGICFVGTRKDGFRNFLQEYLPHPTKPVDFVDIDTGCIVHTSVNNAHAFLFVPGQGAKLAGSAQKYFVVGHRLSVDSNVPGPLPHSPDDKSTSTSHPDTVWVCAGTHHPALYTDSLLFYKESANWIANGEWPRPLREQGQWRTQCCIRHLQPLMDCTVYASSHTDDAFVRVEFDEPVRGVASGQHIVFYGLEGLVCFGGAPIFKRGPTYWERGEELPSQLNCTSHNDVRLSA